MSARPRWAGDAEGGMLFIPDDAQWDSAAALVDAIAAHPDAPMVIRGPVGMADSIRFVTTGPRPIPGKLILAPGVTCQGRQVWRWTGKTWLLPPGMAEARGLVWTGAVLICRPGERWVYRPAAKPVAPLS